MSVYTKICHCGCHPALQNCNSCCDDKNIQYLIETLNKLEQKVDNNKRIFDAARDLIAEHLRKLEKLVNNHEEYLNSIHEVAFHDPEKTMHEMKVLNERIDKLEVLAQERAHLINYKSYLALADRLDEVEKKIKSATEINKKPYKCPICGGKGFVFLMFSIVDSKQEKCNSCESKGIVWG